MSKKWMTYATESGCDIHERESEGKGKRIAYVIGYHDDDKQWVKDARLIATAPELLDVLKYISGRIPAGDTKSIHCIEAVIAKAEGE